MKSLFSTGTAIAGPAESFKTSYKMSAEDRDDLCQTLQLELLGIEREKRIHHLAVRRILCNCPRDFWRVWTRKQIWTLYGEEDGVFNVMPVPAAYKHSSCAKSFQLSRSNG